MQTRLHISACAAVATLLAACGGGSDTAAPVASVQLARAGSIVPLAAPLPADYADLVQRLYLAYTGAPAEPYTIDNFSKFLSSNAYPTTLDGMMNSVDGINVLTVLFSNSLSSPLYFGSDKEFINSVYQNLFNRNVEIEGQEYWAGLIARGMITRAFAVAAIMQGASGSDLAVLNAKLRMSARFATATSAYFTTIGASIGAVGRDLLGKIGPDTDPAVLQSEFDAAVAKVRNSGFDSPLPLDARFAGFNYRQNMNAGASYIGKYIYSYNGLITYAASGKLSFGQPYVDVALDASGYGTPVSAALTVNADRTGTGSVIMLCQDIAASSGMGTVRKSTDILVNSGAKMITQASELANQTLSVYREDCNATTGVQTYVFDAAGNATITTPSGTISYAAGDITALFNGRIITDQAIQNYIALRAYSYKRLDNTVAYAIVTHTAPYYFSLPTGRLALSSQE